MITNEKYFFKNQSSASLSDPLYNVNDGVLILQVEGNVSNLELSVLGNTDLVDDDFVTLKTINASDYNMSDKITSTGIYWVDINGLRKIKLNLSKITGSVSVKAITKRGLTTDLVARAMAANAAGGGSYTLPVASASTLGGIKVGENLTIEEDGTLNAGGGTEVLPIYNVECDISNGPSPNWYNSSSDFATLTKKAINEAYNKGDLHFILNYGSSSNDRGTTLQVVARIYNTNRPILFYTIPEISYIGGIYKEQLISLDYGSWVYANGEWTYPTGSVGAQFITDVPFMTDSSALSTFLSKTNTKSYTPTNDYNPATKKYVDDAVASAGGGEPEMYVLEFSGNYNSSHQYNATDNDKIRVAELITTLKEDANVPIYVKFKNGYGLLFTPLYDIQPGQQPYYLYQCLKYNNSNLRVLYFCGLNIYGTWENDIFTVSTCTVSTDTNGFLSTGTQSLINDGFNPTLDQHPATKKYVDDNSFKLENENIYVLTGNINIASGSINTDDLAKATEIATDIYLKTKENPNYAYNVIVQCNGDASKGLTLYMNHLSGRNDAIIFMGICFYNGYWQEIRCTLIGSFDTSTNKYNVTKIDMSAGYTSLQATTPRLNSEVANKQYVDNSIKAAITTSLEGSY